MRGGEAANGAMERAEDGPSPRPEEGESGALDVDPMAQRNRIADEAERRWGPQGLDAAEKLLNRFPPEVVVYGMEETFKAFPHLTLHGIRTWDKICR